MDYKLNFIHVCDYASVGERGKLNILGTFENIFSKNAPFVHPQLYIVTNVSIEKPGNYKQLVKIIRTRDNQEIIKPLEFALSISQLPPTGEAKIGVIGQLNSVKFEEFGDYTVQVFIDTEKIGEIKINLVQRSG